MFFAEGVLSSHMSCGLKVDTQYRGWDRTMSKILRKIRGVSYDLDAQEGMIYISGKVNPQKILRKITKYGKHAELCWMRTGNQYVYGGGNMDERPYPYFPCGGMPMPQHHRGYHYPYPYHPNYEPMPPLPPPPPPPPLALPPPHYHHLPQLPYYY